MKHPRPWSHGETTHLQDGRVFRMGSSEATSPSTGRVHTFYRIDSVDWVNAIPVTPEGEIVMVRQFRHGSRSVTLEIPGGMVDPGEDAAEAAVRETLEETGYRGGALHAQGDINPNPALFGNRVFTYVIEGATRVAEIENGPTEETVVELVPHDRIRDLLERGDIDHALVVAALYRYLLESR